MSRRFLVALIFGLAGAAVLMGLGIWQMQRLAWKEKYIKAGANTVEVVVIGTYKNTLGPHHNNPPLGIASPHGFRDAPNPGPPAGSNYSTLDYGLMKPFVLTQNR